MKHKATEYKYYSSELSEVHAVMLYLTYDSSGETLWH